MRWEPEEDCDQRRDEMTRVYEDPSGCYVEN